MEKEAVRTEHEEVSIPHRKIAGVLVEFAVFIAADMFPSLIGRSRAFPPSPQYPRRTRVSIPHRKIAGGEHCPAEWMPSDEFPSLIGRSRARRVWLTDTILASWRMKRISIVKIPCSGGKCSGDQ